MDVVDQIAIGGNSDHLLLYYDHPFPAGSNLDSTAQNRNQDTDRVIACLVVLDDYFSLKSIPRPIFLVFLADFPVIRLV